MADLKRLSDVVASYSIVVILGAAASIYFVNLPISLNGLHLITGGLPAAIFYLFYRAYRGKTEVAKYEIPLLLAPVLISPIGGIIIGLILRIVEYMD